jgi:hypothetical protein
MLYFRPTLQKVQALTQGVFFALDFAVHRITGSAVVLGNAKNSLTRVLSLSWPVLASCWVNATQETASTQAITQLTRAQVSLLEGGAALEGSEHVKTRLLANATSVLQLLLADISYNESHIKAKSIDVALR